MFTYVELLLLDGVVGTRKDSHKYRARNSGLIV